MTYRLLALAVLILAFPGLALSGETIRVGATLSLSGPLAASSVSIHLTNYKMWVEEVNAKGGIYLRSMKKALPLELTIYDDEGDVQKGIRLYKKLILEDKADVLLPPLGTTMSFAVTPIVNQYGYPLIVITAALEKFRHVSHKLPYFFMIYNMPREHALALGEILEDLNIRTAAVLYNDCAYGMDSTKALMPVLKKRGIHVPIIKNYPTDIRDFSPLLRSVQAEGAEALLVMSYLQNTFLLTRQAIEMGVNPKLLFLGVGTSFAGYRDQFGADTVEGIMGLGGWNPGLPYPGAHDYFRRYTKRWNGEPNRSSNGFCYAALQVLEQAITEVGALDRKKIRDVIAEKTFSTIIGPVKFEGGFNIHSPGEIGQWQNGEFEVVGRREKRTAKIIYPKPQWKE